MLMLATDPTVHSPAIAPAARAIRRKTLCIGYVRLLDAAPLLVAEAAGLFTKHGVTVELSREPGWATIREKLAHGEIGLASAPGPMAFSLQLGIRSVRRGMCVGMIMNQGGNGITLSANLRNLDVASASDFARELRGIRSIRRYTFGIVAVDSSHNLILRNWLRSGGIDPDTDVRTVILPPEQMPRALAAGHLDGFCVGEPWNAEARCSGVGFTVASSAGLHPGHPEKVLLARKELVEDREEDVVAIMAALLEACEFCSAEENIEDLVALLSRDDTLGFEQGLLRECLSPGDVVKDRVAGAGAVCPINFFAGNANSPTLPRGRWIVDHMDAEGMLGNYNGANRTLVDDVFRPDLFSRARRLRASSS